MARKARPKPKTKEAGKHAGQRILNLLPSRETERDWTMESALAAGTMAVPAMLPKSVDRREAWWTIADQGRTGSCVGWAVADGAVRYHLVKAKKLTQTQLLSVRHVWMASKEVDIFTGRPQTFIEAAGTTLKDALDVCRKHGVVLTEWLPFRLGTLMYEGDENAFYVHAAERKVAAYIQHFRDLNKWKAWLATKGPIVTGLRVDRTWNKAAQTKGKLDTFLPDTVRGGHAVLVVGYTDEGRFIVRNSWGTAWGDQGFAYATPAYIEAGFLNEGYGIEI
jgi:C1A family cysteine protease